MKTLILLPLAALLITASCSKQETPNPSPAGAIMINRHATVSRLPGDTAWKPTPINDGKPRPSATK